ncbi:hypothetical protein BGW80DRAFT_1269818 [Lactifluus volemus]|nr:hypothetical protein BGW80DRAFT_1269818 [Lactifluus volemus]
MEYSTLFLKLRLAILSSTTLICLIWVILLSCVVFLRWDVSSLPERSFVLLFLGLDTLTTVMLPILLLVRFRTWLDGARLLFLLIYHIGFAASFSFGAQLYLALMTVTPDDRGVCQLLNLYIIIASWIPPFLLILYGMCLALYTLHCASLPRRPLSAAEETRAVKSGLKGALERQQMESSSEGQLAYLEDPLC